MQGRTIRSIEEVAPDKLMIMARDDTVHFERKKVAERTCFECFGVISDQNNWETLSGSINAIMIA